MPKVLPIAALERSLGRMTLTMEEGMALIRLVAFHLPRGQRIDLQLETGAEALREEPLHNPRGWAR